MPDELARVTRKAERQIDLIWRLMHGLRRAGADTADLEQKLIQAERRQTMLRMERDERWSPYI